MLLKQQDVVCFEVTQSTLVCAFHVVQFFMLDQGRESVRPVVTDVAMELGSLLVCLLVKFETDDGVEDAVASLALILLHRIKRPLNY
jgi:hypothetical protein